MPRQFSSQSLFHFLFKHSPLPIPVSMSWPSPWLLGSVTCGNFEMGHSKSNSSKLRTISATGLAGSLQIRFRSMSVIHLSCSFFDRCWYRWANTKRFGSLLRLVIKSARYWGLTTTKSLISELWFSAVVSFPGGRSLKKKKLIMTLFLTLGDKLWITGQFRKRVRGSLSYLAYTGMCRLTGYGFQGLEC